LVWIILRKNNTISYALKINIFNWSVSIKNMLLSEKEIKYIAKLARLDLSEEELIKYGGQLSNILNYIDQLKEVDVKGVEPTAQVTGTTNVLREDKIKDWDKEEIELALKDAPEREERFIKVKRVIE